MFDFFDNEDYDNVLSNGYYTYDNNSYGNNFSDLSSLYNGTTNKVNFFDNNNDFSNIFNTNYGNNAAISPINFEPFQNNIDYPSLADDNYTGINSAPIYGPASAEPTVGNTQSTSFLDGITNAGNSLMKSFNGMLPLLFMGSGLMASNSAGKMSNTLNQIAQQEQAKETEYQQLLRQFLSSDFVPTAPNAADYQEGNIVNWTPTDVLARYRAANDDPRYGLQEYMDGEGGMRAEAAARKAAAGGRTGLNALTQLMAMRDYLANGRKTALSNLYQEAQIASDQDKSKLNAAIQEANANIQANSNRYNTDSQRWSNTLNNLFNATNNGSAAASAIAAAQAGGSQYNPILNALASYLGRQQ